jgi:general secretion pathway protein D
LDGEAVMLNFEQAPLSEVVHSILGETLDLDYVIEHPVNGEITLRTRSPIPRDQLLPILESLLRNNNVLMVRGPNDRFFVSGSANARSTVPSYVSPEGALVGFSHVIVPLQYIAAAEMAEILRPVATDDAFVRIDGSRNLLVLAGTQMQLDGWLDIVSTFDVDQLKGMSVGIFPLANSTVEEVFLELSHILNTAEQGEAGIGSLVRVMPVERLNSLLAVSPRAEYVEQVRDWVQKLDNVEDPVSEPTLHVYPVKNGNAAQLANLLSQIYGGGAGGGARTARSNQRSVAPGMTAAGGGNAQASANTNGAAQAGGGSFQIDDNIRVVSDDYNNSLLVYAAPYEYTKIRKTLEQLDVVATQVLIEASIVEVTLTDDLKYGLEWTFDNAVGSDYNGGGLLDLGSGLGRVTPGFSYSITNSAGAVRAVLNTLAQESLINVISTPSVMVLDNHTAQIQVGDQQPIQNQQVVTNGGNVQTSITYRDTGVRLEVTPSVNDGGLVTMEIAQEVTDVGPIDTATGQRSFLNRNVNSKVAVRNGESVVLGGLIRDNATTGRNGVPLLMDIPVIGNLFSTTTDNESRTELLVFITPRVLESDQDLRDLGREMRARMRGLTNFEDLPVWFGGTER